MRTLCVLAGFALALAAGRAAEPAAPMDEPLRLIRKAKENFANVKDYSCVLVKKEKLGDEPPVENVIALKARTAPFSVHLKWQEPKSLANQEAVYVQGKNGGKMRVKPSGLLAAVGFVSLDPDDPRAKQASKHAITEAGLGNLIERTAAGWEAERQLGRTGVKLGEYEYNKRRCVRVETAHPPDTRGRFPFHRFVVYFDKEHGLPVRVECYDWPPGPADRGELVECYSYVNLRTNVGLGDDVFDK